MKNSKAAAASPELSPKQGTIPDEELPICALHPEDFGVCPMPTILRDNSHCPTCELNT